MEQKSPEQPHTELNNILHIRKTSALQTVNPKEREKDTAVPHAEEEAYMEGVEAWRILEVRSHLNHHADFGEWLVR